MSKIFTSLTLLILVFLGAKAQNPVLNFSFESWTGSVLTNWVDQNGGGSISQTTDHLVGAYAVKGTLIVGATATYTPSLASQSGGFPVTMQYQYLRFYYKTNLASGTSGGPDQIFIGVDIRDASNAVAGYPTPNAIIPNNNLVVANAANFTVKQVKLQYTGTPSKVNIVIKANPSNSDPYPHNGTWFIIDSVSLSNVSVGIDEIEEASSTLQAYPNPTKSYLNIKTQSGKPMQIKLSDALGRVIISRMSQNPVNGVIQDTLNTESLSSGLYLLMLTSDKKTIFRRVIID